MKTERERGEKSRLTTIAAIASTRQGLNEEIRPFTQTNLTDTVINMIPTKPYRERKEISKNEDSAVSKRCLVYERQISMKYSVAQGEITFIRS